MIKRLFSAQIILLLLTTCDSNQKREGSENTTDQPSRILQIPKVVGEWKHIFNPNDTRSEIDTTWYTNDHCFIFGPDNKWHAYGIIGHKPINPWTGETKFFHISAKDIFSDSWEDHDYALRAKDGVERVLWAPHVFKEGDEYIMFYNAGNLQENAPNYASWGTLHKATSKDMFHWKRHEFNPLFSDPGHARDSYVMKFNGEYYYYYTRTFNEIDLRSCVAVRKGPDTDHWSGPKIVHTQPFEVDWGGDAESPAVIYKDGLFYLFICLAMTEYNLTHVYWSEDPLNFPKENLVTTIDAHAAEVIQARNDDWYISNTGWDKKGLYVARLVWEKVEK
ncbi:hypothetical protein QQ008_12700 [Fulvivirgaceae bacterium BMA10]|uniref:Family 43 glycosylhydrolase n=1 Tax=Splendidivirga corallicola TaxID=3051826 RepID=A0ABT8KNE1_9BACT|nr:hypothetical protein [Fulvivirgaceae bacterium BMA10]